MPQSINSLVGSPSVSSPLPVYQNQNNIGYNTCVNEKGVSAFINIIGGYRVELDTPCALLSPSNYPIEWQVAINPNNNDLNPLAGFVYPLTFPSNAHILAEINVGTLSSFGYDRYDENFIPGIYHISITPMTLTSPLAQNYELAIQKSPFIGDWIYHVIPNSADSLSGPKPSISFTLNPDCFRFYGGNRYSAACREKDGLGINRHGYGLSAGFTFIIYQPGDPGPTTNYDAI